MGYCFTKRINKAGSGIHAAVTFVLGLLLLCAGPGGAFAKSVLYDGRDGLNGNDINVVEKDSRGLMWIGTHNGLNIYDGYTFTRVTGPLANRHISSLALYEARQQMLVGTDAGLFAVDLATLTTSAVLAAVPADREWAISRAHHIFVDPGTSTAYISFGQGYIARIDAQNRLRLLCRMADTGRAVGQIIAMDGHLLVNNGWLYRIDPGNGSMKMLTEANAGGPFTYLARSGNTLLLNNSSGKLSLLDGHSLKSAFPPELKKKIDALPYGILQAVLRDKRLYLLCNNYTFFVIDLQSGKVIEFSKKYPDIFEGKNYHSLFVDEHDIIWIATNKGLIKAEDRAERFNKGLYSFPDRVSTRKIIEDDNGDLYVSSYNGLWHYSSQTRDWHAYMRNSDAVIQSNPRAYAGPVTPHTLLPETESNYIYLGFDAEQLLRFNKRKKIFETLDYMVNLKKDPIGGIYAIVQDNKGRLWLGCGNGLATYDPVANTMLLHRNDGFDVGNRVRYIAASDNEDLFYVGTVAGLFIVDPLRGILHQLNTRTKPALSNNDLLFVQRDKQGYIWLGTNGGGINVVSPDLKSVRFIRRQDGLSNEVVYAIIPQQKDSNILWISTFNGLDRYRKDRRSFSNYFEEDGLSSNEFNQNSFLTTASGEMYFGSINGITSFDPAEFSEPEPFKVFVSGISGWNDRTQSIQLMRNKAATDNTIVKKPSDLLLELHFGCTDYSDPLRNTYSYRIREVSDKWVTLDDRHTLNLGGIPYGSYTIDVKAINPRGVSSANVLTFLVKVIQPFYRTWWFFALLLLGLAVIFYTAYQIKYQGFKNILHLRMKIASNLHDEVGSLLTRITMFSDNLRYSRNTEEQRNAKLEKIAELSRNAVASMSDVLWTIDSRNDFAGNLLDRMREHAEEMLFPLGIDVNFVLSGTDLNQPISSDTRGEIYLIFKEAVNNIAKHSKASRVDIAYQITDRHFRLKITNNKAGELSNEQSTGQGLSNMRMRATRVGARLTVHSGDDQFTIEVSN
ncbi:ligand-binding sensor domain-containing protein [Taibaiella koreensis]|uniref:ligand-binding sensor domain-containing protein n=1 Tax=Taibaiella koreensis TaxID=1268548 RepID=UPI0013C2FDE8|nr:two-component regulator propeller domain-containing protein [Taibaiella koreensis]